MKIKINHLAKMVPYNDSFSTNIESSFTGFGGDFMFNYCNFVI